MINESRKLGGEHPLEHRLSVDDVLATEAAAILLGPDLDAVADDPEGVLFLGDELVAEVVLERVALGDVLVGRAVALVAPGPARRHQPDELAAEASDEAVSEELVGVDDRPGRVVEPRTVVLVALPHDAALVDEVVEPVRLGGGQAGADLPADVAAEPAAPAEVAEALAELGVDVVPAAADLPGQPAVGDAVHVGPAFAAPVALDLVGDPGHRRQLVDALRVAPDGREPHVRLAPASTDRLPGRVLVVVGPAALEVELVVSRNAHVYLLLVQFNALG